MSWLAWVLFVLSIAGLMVVAVAELSGHRALRVFRHGYMFGRWVAGGCRRWPL